MAVVGLSSDFTALHAQVIINEFLAANGKTNNDDEGDSSDWAELYNTSNEDIDLEGWTISDDAAEPQKWTFPSITIPAGGYLLVWLSGKDRTGIAPTQVDQNELDQLAFRPIYIQRETSWRYRIAEPGTPGPEADWNTIGYNASSWDQGNSGFGYGDGDDVTELPDNTPAVFTRKEFTIPNVDHVTNLIMSINYDDGFVAYLNGTRVAASNAPAEPINNDSSGTSKHEAGNFERYNLTQHINLLENGTNVLAIVGLNNLNPGSSDMSLIAELGVVPSVLHTNFQLEKNGEVILLSNPDREITDGIEFPEQTQDHSYGHLPNATGPWKYLLKPTPELPNETTGFDEPISTNVEISLPAGLYEEGTYQVEMSAEPAGLMQIHYSTNGTTPTPSSTRYTAPLSISRNTVVRVAGFINGERATDIISRSYFIGDSYAGGEIELPVLSLSMEPSEFRWVHENSGARGRSAEREGYFEYFDANGQELASTGFGLRLHGGAGRGGGYSTKKAYKAYFRGSYGDTKLRGRIIPETHIDEFDKLVLRSNFNDSYQRNGRGALLRDEVIRDIHLDTGALASHGTWCVMYVNMEFRGLYNIVERMDEEFCESYYGGKDWDVVKTGNDVLVGTREAWDNLRNFVTGNDMNDPAMYREALKLIDIENYTSYMLVNIWAQNQDWPHNNWYAARPRTPDGKWTFLCWDAEFGLGLHPSGHTSNTYDFVFGRGGHIADIFTGLHNSRIYRGYIRGEAERFASFQFNSDRVTFWIESLRAHVTPDMEDELRFINKSMSGWNSNVNALVSFAENRNQHFLQHVRNSSRTQNPDLVTPVLLRVEPREVTHTGSSSITILGQNMKSNLEVYLNGERVNVTTSTGGTRLAIRLPFDADSFGTYSVRVREPTSGSEDTLADAFVVHPPVPVLTSISPEEGSARGGETVDIVGDYFLDGVKVFFGNAESPSVERFRGSRRRLVVVTPPGRDVVDVRVVNTTPGEYESETTLPFTYDGGSFLRGDATDDGRIDISDPLKIVYTLFAGQTIECDDAADVDDNEQINVTDAIYLLDFMFREGPAPAAPYPAFGPDPFGAELMCGEF